MNLRSNGTTMRTELGVGFKRNKNRMILMRDRRNRSNIFIFQIKDRCDKIVHEKFPPYMKMVGKPIITGGAFNYQGI